MGSESRSDSDRQHWRDERRYLWTMALVVPLIPFGAVALSDTVGRAFLWLGPAVVLVIVPALDLLSGTDDANPPEWAAPALEADRWYRALVYAFLPLQFLALAYGAWIVASRQLGPVDLLGLGSTVGLVAGVGINAAHELGHKPVRFERWLSRIALSQSGYGHFFVEHNRGHHLRVATQDDPASARLGESFWAFLPRTVRGGLRSAWRLEARRLRGRERTVFGPGNEVLRGWALTAVIFGALLIWLGWTILPYLAIQAVTGFCLLEVVNYIEHYGLARQRDEKGRYERCRPEHSWNANQRVSNLLLYQLERHSDHHANPTRRYQALRHVDDAPQLPTGYGGMIALACVPPLWRRVMDPRVEAHYGGDLTLANVHPPASAR